MSAVEELDANSEVAGDSICAASSAVCGLASKKPGELGAKRAARIGAPDACDAAPEARRLSLAWGPTSIASPRRELSPRPTPKRGSRANSLVTRMGAARSLSYIRWCGARVSESLW